MPGTRSSRPWSRPSPGRGRRARWTVPGRRVVLAGLGVTLLGGCAPTLSGQASPAAQTQAPAAPADSLRFAGMDWRNIGPFRGGRSVAVSGVVGHPRTYYFGATGGGMWKTTDAGETWRNVSDGFFRTGSVGAVAVSESDPNVVYVGMGEHAVRGVTTSHGDGVYRSTDAGRTWEHVGLENTRAISRIRIHPTNPELVYVAAQGAPYGASEDRGVYRSRDGGETWEKVLYVSDRAGASELSMDMTNPRILYAGFWDHLRRPWVVESGGPGSGIWKSTDGGDTWTELTDGLPGTMGKVAVDVSRAEPDRVYANVEAADGKGGVYRSDDAGATWTQTNAERVTQARAWYYIEVYADPVDPETVYVLNAPMLRSTDGGRTFEEVDVPHGDNHDLWINPRENRTMINANDGGANVSFNAGESWSTQRNQPTAQFYRVITDAQFPYRVYGGQQDNSTVSIASASPGGIDWKDWHAVSGCESAYLAFDPEDPEQVYGGCYQGLIDVWNRTTGQSKPVMAYPYLGLGGEPSDRRYRFNWNAPIVASPHDPSVIYHAANVLLRTEDGGQSWEEISPDLTRDEEEKQGPGGVPITNEAAGGEVYNTIFYVEPSPHDAGTIWVGTDDGLVQVTRDGGASWSDVTPPAIGGEALINSIDVSPHDAATAYVVASRYKFDDFTPHVFRTTDFGATWTRIVQGIAPDHWVRVVREDPEREGVLYAGTEQGMYLSLDGGRTWRSWQLDLPVVPVTDLTVRDGDLVAATQGRGFWILDDLSPVRQWSDEVEGSPTHLFGPRTTVLAPWIVGGGGFGGGSPAAVGENPPAGAQIYAWFAEAPDTLVTLEILDGAGQVLRTYATDPEAAGDSTYSELPEPVAGLNRFSWDLRREGVPPVPGLFVFGSLNGRLVPPGAYQVRLASGDRVQTRELLVRPDPRSGAETAAYADREDFLANVQGLATDIHRAVNRMRGVRDQVEALVDNAAGHAAADTLEAAGSALVDSITAWEETLVQPKQETFQDVINFPNRLSAQTLALLASVDGQEPPVTEGARERLADLQEEWADARQRMEAILSGPLAAFNDLVRAEDVPPVVVPPGG